MNYLHQAGHKYCRRNIILKDDIAFTPSHCKSQFKMAQPKFIARGLLNSQENLRLLTLVDLYFPILIWIIQAENRPNEKKPYGCLF